MEKDIYKKIYEPREDSDLLLKHALKEVNKKTNLEICEVGVGSGYVISNITRKNPQNKYYGTDINPYAIDFTKKRLSKINISCTLKKTDLFMGLKTRFDLILFNTPYLPCEDFDNYNDLPLKDKAIYGGKKGYEVIERFVLEVYDYLKDNGKVIMVFSSYSHLDYIKTLLENNLYNYKILEEKRVFFEILYIIEFEKKDILKEVFKLKITRVKHLARGKHSTVLEGIYNKQSVVIKIGKPKDIQIEKIFLEKLKKEKFVPRLYLSSDEFVIIEKLNGVQICNFLKTKNKKKDIISVFNKLLEITRKLDSLKINKFEFTNPYKHIFIDKDLNVKLIDFERCLYTQKPKNTTQFLQYIQREKNEFSNFDIEIDEQKIREIAKQYKQKGFNFKFEDLFY